MSKDNYQMRNKPVVGSLDRAEDPVAVLCYRSSTGRVTSLTREASHDRPPCPHRNIKWLPPPKKSTLHHMKNKWIPPNKNLATIKPTTTTTTTNNSNTTKSNNPNNTVPQSSALVSSATSSITKKNHPAKAAVKPKKRHAAAKRISKNQKTCPIPHAAHFKSNGISSQRTQGASVSHHVHAGNLKPRALANHHKRTKIKQSKLTGETFIEINIPKTTNVFLWTNEDLKKYELVFYGGNNPNDALKEPTPKHIKRHNIVNKQWKSLRICDGDLFIADTKRGNKGLVKHDINGDPIFIRVPRSSALEMTGMNDSTVTKNFFESLCKVEKVQRGSLYRGNAKNVYSDFKMCCPGVQPCRAARGVRDSTYHQDLIPSSNWDNIVETVQKIETVMAAFVPTEELRKLNNAKEIFGYKTLRPTCDGNVKFPCKIFGSLSFARNVHLGCHTDKDFSKSIVTVCMDKGGYSIQDNVIAYFCFPRIGIAVALRPGDILIFNPSEPHAVSSRCNSDDEIFCVSMYLKTAIVSLNDNTIPLTPSQEKCVSEFKLHKKK